MVTLNSYLSIVTLNVNGLNDPIKKRRVSDWIIKQDPSICCLQETHFRQKDTYSLKIKVGEPFTFRVTIERCEFSVTMISIQSLFLWIVPLNFFLKGNFKITP